MEYQFNPNDLLTEEGRKRIWAATGGYDQNGNNEIGTMAQNYSAALYPEVGREIDFLVNTLGPRWREYITSFLDQMNDPAALAADRQAFANQSYEDAGQSGSLLALMLRGSGHGDGASSGAIQGQYQGAQRQVNQFNSQQMSPQAKLQRIMASMQAIEQGMNTPALNTQMGLFAPIEQRAQQNARERQQNNWLTNLTGMAGQIAGGMGGGMTSATSNPLLSGSDLADYGAVQAGKKTRWF